MQDQYEDKQDCLPTQKLPAWAMPTGDVTPSEEDKKRAEAIMKATGLIPLKDAIIHLKATKAKEKEISVENAKPKPGDKKFKTERVDNYKSSK